MKLPRNVTLYMEPPLRKSVKAGAHNFINLLIEELKNARFRVSFRDLSELYLHRDGYALTHMKAPPVGKGATFRRSYHYPFWHLERTAERWHWDVAQANFDASTVPEGEAQQFYRFWRNRLFGAEADEAVRGDYIYVPLQGRLLQQRSFQSCSPIEMLRLCVEHNAGRDVVSTLHPKESYTAEELAALERLSAEHSQLRIGTGGMERHLLRCNHVVTQNSSAAFHGFYFGKPAVLFAEIDFHHIAIRATPATCAEAFDQAWKHEPDYARYLWWFLQRNAINAGRDTAPSLISQRFAELGWPMQ